MSIIIVNFNAGEWLARCVQSVLSQTIQSFECFIVDNGSTDSSMDTLPKLDPRFQIIMAGDNLGFAAANNLAAKRATAPWLALLNPDAFANPDWVEQLLNATNLAPNVTMVGSLQYMALLPDTLDGTGDVYHFSGIAWRSKHLFPAENIPATAEVFAPCAAAALYKREKFIRLGGFDERFFCYHEDIDLAFRFRLDGGICVQSSDAIVKHISSGISGRASPFAVYHGTRNRVWTFVKDMPGPLLALFFPFLIMANLAFLLRAFFKRRERLEPTWQGFKDGLAGIPIMLKSRKSVHQDREIRWYQILPVLTYSPIKILRRDISLRPLKKRES